MILQNNTSIQIECITEEGRKFSVPPKGKANIEFDEVISGLEIHHIYKSSRKRLFDVDNIYHMVIDSKINVENSKNDSMIFVSCELVHFDLGYVYDKFLFYSQNCQIISENCWVSNLMNLKQLAHANKKKDSHFDRLLTFFLSGGFWLSTGLFVLFKLSFWANDWTFPVWLIVLFWLLGYFVQVIGEKTVYKYILRKQPKLAELNKYATMEYIMSYFQNPGREWIGDDKVDL